MVDGLILSGGVPSWVAPEYDPELGMAHGVTPEALERALAATPEARAAFIVSPTYYGMAADVGGCAEVAHAAGAALIVDNAWGAHFGFHPRLPASPLDARRRRDARLDPQDRRQPHPVGDAAGRRDRADRHRRGRPRRPAGPLDQPELAADGVARRGPPAARGPRRGAARPDDPRRPTSARAAIDAVAGMLGRGGGAGRAVRGSPAGIRCGS